MSGPRFAVFAVAFSGFLLYCLSFVHPRAPAADLLAQVFRPGDNGRTSPGTASLPPL